jgi:hypothetical protein
MDTPPRRPDTVNLGRLARFCLAAFGAIGPVAVTNCGTTNIPPEDTSPGGAPGGDTPRDSATSPEGGGSAADGASASNDDAEPDAYTTPSGDAAAGADDAVPGAPYARDSGVAPPDAGGPLLFEDFNPADFNGNASTNGLWQIAGPWTGTGSNYLNPANAKLTATYGGQPGGYLSLSVVATNNQFNGSCSGGASASNPCQGAEIQTNGTTNIPGSTYNGSNLRYGYYEVRMKVTSTPGVVISFFWKLINYGTGEIDIEFLTNEPWATDPSKNGTVYFTVEGGPNSYKEQLGFNPTTDFHRYGFLWTPTMLQWTIDGQPSLKYTDPPVTAIPAAKGGYIMMNTWTGNANWGGGPPTQDATSEYDWVKYWPDVTSIPSD